MLGHHTVHRSTWCMLPLSVIVGAWLCHHHIGDNLARASHYCTASYACQVYKCITMFLARHCRISGNTNLQVLELSDLLCRLVQVPPGHSCMNLGALSSIELAACHLPCAITSNCQSLRITFCCLLQSGMIPIQMELGGKDACIVCEDADLELAAKNIVKVCLCFSDPPSCSLDPLFFRPALLFLRPHPSFVKTPPPFFRPTALLRYWHAALCLRQVLCQQAPVCMTPMPVFHADMTDVG